MSYVPLNQVLSAKMAETILAETILAAVIAKTVLASVWKAQ